MVDGFAALMEEAGMKPLTQECCFIVDNRKKKSCW
jgi:hypothetical protein